MALTVLIVLLIAVLFQFPEFIANLLLAFSLFLEYHNWLLDGLVLWLLGFGLVILLFLYCIILGKIIDSERITNLFLVFPFVFSFVFILLGIPSIFVDFYLTTSFPLNNANKELVAYAQTTSVQYVGCASSPRYDNVLACTVKMQDKSLYKAFCPWKPWLHGCVLGDNMYATKSSRELIKMEVNAMAMAENKGLSETFNNKFERSNINNFSNKVSDNARQQGNQNIYTNEQKQDLAESAAEIQRLLKQLEESNPTATESEKVAYVNDETTPSLKRRVVKALIAGGESAIEEFLDNSYAKVIHSVIKGWMESN